MDTTMTVAGQTAVEYSYDDADRLTGITQGTASVTMTHDNANRRTSLTLPNGILVEYAYDDASRLTSLTYKQGGSTLGDLTYTYDAAGQRTSVGGTYARTGLPAALTSATYDDANQIAAFGGTTFTYDDNGNLTSDGVRSYTWDARNQLASLAGPVNASFAYDAFGRRRGKTVGSTTTGYLFDGMNPVQELAGSTVLANLLTGLGIDEYFTRTDANGALNYLTDALGSSVALADGSGTIQTDYTYEAFGGTATSGAGSGNAFAFTGRESDGTGLYFYRARFYDPRLQRFIEEDPLDFLGGDVNVYAYVWNQPTGFVDPTGEVAWIPVIGCAAGAGGSAVGDMMAGRKINWPAAGAGCAMGAFGGFGGGAAAAGRGAAAAAAGGAGRGAAGAGRGAARGAAQAAKKAAQRAAQNKQARDAAREAGLDRAQRRQLHDAISKQGVESYAEILEIAKAIKAGTWW